MLSIVNDCFFSDSKSSLIKPETLKEILGATRQTPRRDDLSDRDRIWTGLTKSRVKEELWNVGEPDDFGGKGEDCVEINQYGVDDVKCEHDEKEPGGRALCEQVTYVSHFTEPRH